MFEPAQLRSFLAVAETLSFTKAAERLGPGPAHRQPARPQAGGRRQAGADCPGYPGRAADRQRRCHGRLRPQHPRRARRRRPLLLRIRHARPPALRHGRRPRHHRPAPHPPGVPADLSADQPRADGGPERPALQAPERRPAGPGLREMGGRGQGRDRGPAGRLRLGGPGADRRWIRRILCR